MTQLLMLLLFFPIIIPIIMRYVLHKTISTLEMGITIGVTCLVVIGVCVLGVANQTDDEELLNGKVIKKIMKHEECPSGWHSYTDDFCTEYTTREVCVGMNCTTDSNGNQSCVPEYETEYKYIYPWEQKWFILTNLKEFYIERIDDQGAKEPPRYKKVNIDDPVSIPHTYTNYIKAVPDSLFNNSANILAKYEKHIPPYPHIYDIYNVNRILLVGIKKAPHFDKLNVELGKMLGRLNPQKQVNVNIILTNIQDPEYSRAVEQKWVGGKKNDVTIVFGVANNQIVWFDVFTWARNKGNGVFVSTLKDELQPLKIVDLQLINKLESTIRLKYDRPHNSDFEYLTSKIQPSDTMIMIAVILEIICMLGMLLFFHKNEV